MNKRIVILGCGFVGFSLQPVLEDDAYLVYATSREPDKNEYLKNHSNKIIFNLSDKSTYKNIPEDSEIIWTFPATPLDKVSDFYNFVIQKNCRIRIVLGTTSAYTNKQGIITENSPLDLESPRLQGENFLMKNSSVVLQLSGIYSENKHPFNWLNKGLIKNSNKTVNLIHIKDIGKIISKILKTNLSGERFNLSDGNKYWWKDIWKIGKESNKVFSECPSEMEIEDRLISNKKLKKFLGNDYQFFISHLV